MRQLRIVASLLAAILLTTACAADPALDNGEVSAVKEAIRLLEQEEASLNGEIAERYAALFPDPVCVLCLDGAHASVFESAFSLLKQSGYPAVITVRPDTLPGKEGMITPDQAKNLVDAGWEFIPAGSSEILPSQDGELNPDWEDDLDQILSDLEELDLPAPSCFAFAPDTYDPLADQALEDRGITVALHRWSDEQIQTERLNAYGIDPLGREFSARDPAYRIGGSTICANPSTAQRSVYVACVECAVAAVCTGEVKPTVDEANLDVDCTESKYQLMLDSLATYTELAGLRVLTFSGVCQYKQEFEAELDRRKADYEDFSRQAQERVEEIDQELAAILRQRLEEDTE